MTATMTAALNFLKSLLLIGAYLSLMSLVIWIFRFLRRPLMPCSSAPAR